MVRLAFLFLVFALVAAMFGFKLIMDESMLFAQVLFVVFLVLAVVSFLVGMFRGRPTRV